LSYEQITGESEAVKKALFAVSAIMFKFSPKEEIPLETTVPEAPPSIIISSDVPIYQPGGFYPNADPIVSSRSVPPILGATHIPEFQGYGDMRSSWPIYSSTVPVVPSFGNTSRSELIIRLLCPFDKIGRVIGKGGSTIKSIRQVSGARIEVDDTKADRDECIITVIATEVWFTFVYDLFLLS
jgi:poly(rC)-binding protein 2/3/4